MLQLSYRGSTMGIIPKPGVNLSSEAKKAMFEMAKKADEEYQESLKVARRMLEKRSGAIREILDLFGAGPFLVDGKEVRIVVRADRKTGTETVFFRQLNTKDVESI